MAENVKVESDQIQVIMDSLNKMHSGELQITVQDGKIVKIIRIENWS